MTANTTAQQLRLLSIQLEAETRGLSNPFTSSLLDIASKIETMEGNLVYLTSCMAATADELVERKSTPLHQISRQHGLMEACARSLAGFPVWKHASTVAWSLDRVERVRALIATRLNRVPR